MTLQPTEEQIDKIRDVLDEDMDWRGLYSTSEKLFALIRDIVLEEAALVVEDTDVVEAKPGYGGSYYAQLGDAKATLSEAATAVRAMKGTP